MAYLKNWLEVSQVLDDMGAKRFHVTRTRGDYIGNNNVYTWDADKSLEENKQTAERILQRCAGEIMYLTLWRNENGKNTGNTYAILYDVTQPITPNAAPAPQVAGLYDNGKGGVDINKLSSDIETRLRVQFEKERLDRLEKDLDKRERELRANEQSAIGLLAGYLAPIAKQLAGRLPNVAGLDAKAPVHAQPIHAVETEAKQSRDAADIEPSPKDNEEEQEIFTEEESDKLLDLMARFKAVEPDYLKLLEAVVTMAESGDSTYTMAKGFLLK